MNGCHQVTPEQSCCRCRAVLSCVTGASGLVGRARFRRWWLPSRQQGRGLLEMSGGCSFSCRPR